MHVVCTSGHASSASHGRCRRQLYPASISWRFRSDFALFLHEARVTIAITCPLLPKTPVADAWVATSTHITYAVIQQSSSTYPAQLWKEVWNAISRKLKHIWSHTTTHKHACPMTYPVLGPQTFFSFCCMTALPRMHFHNRTALGLHASTSHHVSRA